jgi:hypothetical protein
VKRFLILILLLLNQTPALACAVCGVGKEESRWAYIGTTALLTVVPLTFLIGGAFYIYKRFQESAANED